MNLSGKRSASPLPRKLEEVFRPRISHDKKDKFQSATTSLGASLVREGQEVLSLSVSLKHDLRHENVNDLILGTTIRLAQEGKRLIKAPRLLSDGIAFDWISDTTARNEDIKSLFSVEGIRVQDLEMVLLRATPVPGGYTRAATEGPSNLAQSSIPPYPNLTGVDAQGPSAAAIKGAGIGSASDPIVVDDDGESASERVSRPGGCFISPRRSSSEALRFSRHADRSSSYGAASSQRRPLPTTDVSVPVSSHYKKSEGSPLHIRHPHRSIPQSPEPLYSHDRLSVVSYASRGAETPSSEDVIQGVRVCPSQDGDVRYDTPEYGSLRSIPFINARSKGAADSSEGRAEYGEWKHLAEDSSDVEMEAGHPSSRESSLARSIPPQKSTHAVTGLPFLPQTYDTSDLVLQQPSAPASGTTRTGASPSNSSSTSERDNSPPRRAPELPRRRIDRPSRNGEDSDGSIDGESPPVQSLSRRRPVEASKPSTGQGIYLSEDDSDINSGSKVQKPTAAHRQQRSSAGSRTLRKVQPGSSVKAALQRRRSAPDRPRRSARRSTSHASEEVNYSSLDEDDDESPASSSATLGHTLVIPKADYARGRRLLVPASLDSPITTVLMRGEAHFIDQRRKTRMYQYSLHVQDDFRHVEDACLLGDGTAVVGYDKGPSQVSLITVEGTQRPSRIDLNHKAHTTVMENRSVGRAYPNRGISCLAPVADGSFLSGGHDKFVYHWKLERAHSRKKDRGGFSVSSVRVPTEHTQSIQALAFCAWNETVYSAAGDRIAMTKLGAVSRAETERVSGKVTQVHVHPQDPRLIAVEVDHMDHQVHFYDMREGGFARKPWLEFGYRATPPKANSASPNLNATAARPAVASQASANANASRSASSAPVARSGSRYTRGSTMNSLFARGYGDGAVLVWDYRNGAQKKVLERFQFQRPAEVVHTVLAGSDVIAYGGYTLTFWSMLAADS